LRIDFTSRLTKIGNTWYIHVPKLVADKTDLEAFRKSPIDVEVKL
jgi:hypothetical protein